VNNIIRHFGHNVRLSELTAEMIFEFQQKRLGHCDILQRNDAGEEITFGHPQSVR